MTVCVPASREAGEVAVAVDSVLSQTFTDFELLLSDDSGALEELARGYRDERIRYVAHRPALGFVANHRFCIREARGDLVAFLHDDDRWLPDYLAEVTRVFEDDPSTGVVLTDCYLEDEGGELEPRGASVTPGRHGGFLSELLVQMFFMLPTLTTMRREVALASEPEWPDLRCGDMIAYLRAAEAGWAFHYIARPLAVYHRHSRQLSAPELAFRGDLVSFWSGLSFADPHHEELRRRRLAFELRNYARALFKARRMSEARAASAQAADLSPSGRDFEGRLIGWAASSRWVRELVLDAWRAYRGLRGLRWPRRAR